MLRRNNILLIAILILSGVTYLRMHLDEVSVSSLFNDVDKSHESARIAFKVTRSQNGSFAYRDLFNPMRCHFGPKSVSTGRGNRRTWSDRIALAEYDGSLHELLNFTTHIFTSLNIIVMGDSVGMQFAQGLQEAANIRPSSHNEGNDGAVLFEIRNDSSVASSPYRTVYRESWPTHEGLNIMCPTHQLANVDGRKEEGRVQGAIAGWRITGMLKRSRENMPLPNSGGGGWVREDAAILRNHTCENSDRSGFLSVTKFDILFFRIPHPWISATDVTLKALRETVELAVELFGVRTVIFTNLYFNNNVQTADDWNKVRRSNDLIESFAKTWNTAKEAENGIHVSVLDLAAYADALFQHNAQTLGYEVNSSSGDRDYMFNRLSRMPDNPMPIPAVCAEKVNPGSPDCKRNGFSRDGMHWCMQAIGGRLFAGLACLAACSNNAAVMLEDSSKEACERRCNSQYMGLLPLQQ